MCPTLTAVAIDYGITGAPETYLIAEWNYSLQELAVDPDIMAQKDSPMVKDLNK